MALRDLVSAIRSYRGVQRKRAIRPVALDLLAVPKGRVMATHGEDAAVIQVGKEILLMAADGIMEDLVRSNPRWAGYCAVLVNVNDIAAMGGVPIAMVNVLSCPEERIRREIVKGMKEACEKFSVPMVGGHLHPDSSYSAVDVAVLGRTDRTHLVLSSGASKGDLVVFAIDLDGEFTEGIPYSWDTTSRKNKAAIQRQLKAMMRVAPYVTAGKDISNPGSLGSLGMLLEASRKGAVVDIDRIPKPEGVDLVQWLTAYQGCGFVVTARHGKERQILQEFARAGIEADVCGTVKPGSTLEVLLGDESETLFDFSRDTLGCAAPQKI